jgi:carboxyl-terminal processing protease
MQKLIRKIRNNGLLLTAVCGIILLSYGFMNAPVTRDFRLTKNMDIFFSLIREISIFYVDETDPENLIQNAISGVLQELDPYTTFIPESEKENYATMTTGRYGGIGSLIRQSGDYVMITEPYENFPAQRSGLRAGDIITSIDGSPIRGYQVSAVSELLKGPPKSPVKLTIRRPGQDNDFLVEIRREEIRINNVTWHGRVADGIGYIQLNGFTENAHQEVRDALNELKRDQGVSKLILDLRGNPGGLLMEAIQVTNLFVEKGEEIVSTRGKVKQWDDVYRAGRRPADAEIPLVILVDESSASAAEIVAGAVQDLDRGVVIGRRTFGKGLIQATRPLSYNAQLKITTAKYYTPSGRGIQAWDFSSGNGTRKNLSDSLIREFSTRNGRQVFDGGGIMPDIHIEEQVISPLVINLMARNFIFDYATAFASDNSSIPPVSDFTVSDETYASFIDFLKSKDFDYQTQTENHLKQLSRIAKEENYYEASSDLFEDLRNKIELGKQRDFDLQGDFIRSLLKGEIVSRYYYQKGRIQSSLENDPDLDKAIEVLKNPSLYGSILNSGSIYAAND